MRPVSAAPRRCVTSTTGGIAMPGGECLVGSEGEPGAKGLLVADVLV
ncbi:hypothetical protein PV367_30240 [Streptomyces europaeiscabiei]|uniref:Uncharacterized protein n=1 Tax=Streptomyces europaeiscabiei TaxID=146819 RepID=A0AAJ2PUK7_9ACTN|nr:hypothetical protein [Streptomyces europaeiscabiei]MDX3133969.1 hypothetical protein [Streptomyces europaeiscabiei]